jgi:hypothetical protein
MAVWDTSVASGLHPDDRHFELASETAPSAEPILLAAPTVQEIAFGLQRKAGEDQRFGATLSWFTEILDAGVLGGLPLTWEAALLAGPLACQAPCSPCERGRPLEALLALASPQARAPCCLGHRYPDRRSCVVGG